jgi:hypothetical protein
MQRFRQIFPRKCSVIGMIHVDPLPGTPGYVSGSFGKVLEKARHEAAIYKASKIVSWNREIQKNPLKVSVGFSTRC